LKKKYYKTIEKSEDIASLIKCIKDKKAIIQFVSFVYYWKDIEELLKKKFKSI